MAEGQENIIDKIVLDPLEDVMNKFGLMQGEYAPAKRSLVGFAAGTGLTYLLKPSWAYLPDGTPREWKVTHAHDQTATYTPWWTLGAMGGFVLGVLI